MGNSGRQLQLLQNPVSRQLESSLLGALAGVAGGTGGVTVEIQIDPPLTATGEPVQPCVVLDHEPSWRLHRNPFWRVQHPGGAKVQPVGAPPPSALGTPGVSGGALYAGQPVSPDPLGTATPQKEVIYAFVPSQIVSGRVVFRTPPGGKPVEHLGVRVQFIGRIDMGAGVHEGKPHYDFVSLSKELAPPGALHPTVMPFSFRTGLLEGDQILESYRGRNVAVRYLVKVQMDRKFLPPLKKERDVWLQMLGTEPDRHEPIKMEVGIEDCLHIEFEYDRRVYHLQDTIRGRIHFLLVRIKIKHMELAVIRRETSGEGVAAAAAAQEGPAPAAAAAAAGSPAPPPSVPVHTSGDGSNIFTETQTLVKYEIMDGAPVKGEVIPVKLSLQGIPADLTPTYTAVNNRFSVRYFLNLVLVDEDDRRYFKQQEIILWRKELG